MKILALEFSSSHRSAALIVDGAVRAESIETGGRTAHAFEIINRTLAEIRMEREQVECIAVGLGPGSYTGIRAAIAVAQGWQLARGTRLAGVGVVPAMAATAHGNGWHGKLNLVIDAQRNEFYLAVFDLRSDGIEEVNPLHLATKAEVELALKRDEIVAGPDLEQAFPAIRPLFPSASSVGLLAARQKKFVPGESLSPIYLREAGFVKAPPPRNIP